jgi:predicted enzyme related to lactoylglutathione lyase
VPEPKATKNRLHLDLVADRPIHEEVDRLVAMGATVRNWAEDGDESWAVLLDPEGNEFCVLPDGA